MLDIMYDIPSQSDVKEVVVNEEVIVKGEQPLIVYDKEEAELGLSAARCRPSPPRAER